MSRAKRTRQTKQTPRRPAVVQANADQFTDVDSRLLVEVSRSHREVGAATVRREAAIGAARASGATWTELASVLGVTPQAVQKRYGAVSGERA